MSAPLRLGAHAYAPLARVAAALFLALAAACVLDLAAGMFLDLVAPGPVERVPPPLLVRRLLLFAAVPVAGFLLLRWRARASIEIGDDSIAIEAGRARWQVPRASVAGVVAWRLPWPGAGAAILLGSGRRLRPGLAMPDPTPLVAALGGDTGAPPLVFARARLATRWLRHPLHALLLAPLVPTAILFRLHQILTTGGWLGEYRWYGLGRWLHTLLGVWLSVAGSMLCWFAAWRLAVAVLAWPAARLTEPRARAVRWILEVVALAGYYGGAAWFLWARLGA